jgi:tRNA dimethylallyltransferase
MTELRAILIAGPTASGKSAMALRLAEDVGGAIVNADSMQVYRELRVLTARPSLADEARVPHLLYGHVPASEAYSAGRYTREAAAAIAEVRGSGRVPIVVGGTGLYFRALLHGLSPIPAISDDIRRHWRGEAVRLGAEALHALLAERDPDMAGRLRPSDPQRVTRALEVLDATGRSLAEWQQVRGTPILDEHATERFVVQPDREDLYRRCDARFEAMLAGGALEEVRALMALGLNPGLPAPRALGVQALAAHLAGAMSLDEAREAAKRETRRYAKRQLTWLRGQMSSWTTIASVS